MLATDGVRYATQAEREIVDVFTCISNHTVVDRAGRLMSCNSQRFLRDGRRMAAVFKDLPEALANTALLSQRLEFKLNDLGYEFAQYPVPANESMKQLS